MKFFRYEDILDMQSHTKSSESSECSRIDTSFPVGGEIEVKECLCVYEMFQLEQQIMGLYECTS